MTINKKQPIAGHSLDDFKNQETDGTNIEGGGGVINPDNLDPGQFDPNDFPDLPDASDENSNAGNDPTGTYVHTSTG